MEPKVYPMEPPCIQHYKITRQVLTDASDLDIQKNRKQNEQRNAPNPSYTFRFTDNMQSIIAA